MRERERGRSGLQVSAIGLARPELDESASHIQPAGGRFAPAQMAMVGREAPPAPVEA